MGINGDDLYMPVMYQDLASASMQPMPMLGITGGCNTNYLGGTKIPEQLDKDKFQKMQDKEKKDFGLLKKVGIALLVMAGIGFVRFAPIKKWVTTNWSKLTNWCKNLFKSKPPATPRVTP